MAPEHGHETRLSADALRMRDSIEQRLFAPLAGPPPVHGDRAWPVGDWIARRLRTRWLIATVLVAIAIAIAWRLAAA